jgi:hypothetical protein
VIVRTLLLVFLGGIVLVILVAMFRKKEPRKPQSIPVPDLAEARITDARNGDTVSIHGLGDEFDDLDFTVDRRNRYEAGGDVWHEVSGLYRGRRVFAEFYEDDVLEVNLTKTPRPLTLEDLGITEEDLIRMDEERTRANTVEYDGVTWSYQESCEVAYFKDGTGEGEGCYSWEFESPDGHMLLCIEKWEGAPFEATLAQVVNPEDIRVFRA